jgi:molybdopterin molybdotransferase
MSVIVTGGVSVGDYDFVANTLNLLQVNKVFHGVAQKPGQANVLRHFQR